MELIFEQVDGHDASFLNNARAIHSPDGSWVVLAEVVNHSSHPISMVYLHATALDEMADLVAIDEIRIASLLPGETRAIKFMLASDIGLEIALIRLGVSSGAVHREPEGSCDFGRCTSSSSTADRGSAGANRLMWTINQLRAINSSMGPKLRRLGDHPEAEQLQIHHGITTDLINAAIVSQIPITFGEDVEPDVSEP